MESLFETLLKFFFKCFTLLQRLCAEYFLFTSNEIAESIKSALPFLSFLFRRLNNQFHLSLGRYLDDLVI